MVAHMYPKFLEDRSEYRAAEEHWNALWSSIKPAGQADEAWLTPWLGTGSPEIRDGNPIFSAWSPRLKRGVRVIQHEPTSDEVEFSVWFDTFGGDAADPESIHELVIACALSSASSCFARELIHQWVHEGRLSMTSEGQGLPNGSPKSL